MSEGTILPVLEKLAVLYHSAQKLRDLINAKTQSFGATPSGVDWCVKALHPSDPITEVRGVPDKSCFPTMFMNYQTVATITPPVNATGTWSTDLQLIPHPICFCAGSATFSTGTTSIEILNSQVPGALPYAHVQKYANFIASFKRWRLAYASVTVYQDGPDLANQGTVVACQKPVAPFMYNLTNPVEGGYPSHSVGAFHAFHMEASDLPNYSNSQSMPNAYFGRSRDGLYMPLKLSGEFDWHSPADSIYQASAAAINDTVTSPTYLQVILPYNTNIVSSGQRPFITLNDAHAYRVGTAEVQIAADPTSAFCSTTWGDISFRNMAVTTSLSCFFRFGFECQVAPESTMSPQLKLSPPYDRLALETYFAISRELKDGFPADYNDLGKIWSVIKDAASAIAPMVSLIPGVGPLLVGGGKVVGSVVDAVSGAVKRTTGPTLNNTASESDKEKTRQVVRANAAPVPVRRRPKRRRLRRGTRVVPVG